MRKRWKLLLLLILCLGLLILYESKPVTAVQLLRWQPENLYLAAVALLLAYVLKSMLVFVPLMLPQILIGHLYPRAAAFALNLLGLVVVMAVPYAIGRKLGSGKMERLMERYPKLSGIRKFQQENEMALCFMLRFCAVPPADIVTMYLGASGVGFGANVLGGVLGSLPSMVLTTVLGETIRDPSSPMFWKALALNIGWIVLSALGFWLMPPGSFQAMQS